MTGKKSFTLMEIIVTLMVIGVLAAISIPAYNTFVQNGASQSAANNLSAIYAAQQNYYFNKGTYCVNTGSNPTCADNLSDINTNLSLNVTDSYYSYSCAVPGSGTNAICCSATANNSNFPAVASKCGGTCTPNCVGVACGGSNGCGSTCQGSQGTCASGFSCVGNSCVANCTGPTPCGPPGGPCYAADACGVCGGGVGSCSGSCTNGSGCSGGTLTCSGDSCICSGGPSKDICGYCGGGVASCSGSCTDSSGCPNGAYACSGSSDSCICSGGSSKDACGYCGGSVVGSCSGSCTNSSGCSDGTSTCFGDSCECSGGSSKDVCGYCGGVVGSCSGSCTNSSGCPGGTSACSGSSDTCNCSGGPSKDVCNYCGGGVASCSGSCMNSSGCSNGSLGCSGTSDTCICTGGSSKDACGVCGGSGKDVCNYCEGVVNSCSGSCTNSSGCSNGSLGCSGTSDTCICTGGSSKDACGFCGGGVASCSGSCTNSNGCTNGTYTCSGDSCACTGGSDNCGGGPSSGGTNSTPFLFTFKNGKYYVENDVLVTYKNQYYELAKQGYEQNSGDPRQFKQTDYYKIRLNPDVTADGVKLLLKEIEPEEDNIDEVRLIRVIHPQGSSAFVDEQSQSIQTTASMKSMALKTCTTNDGKDCSRELSAIDDQWIEGNKGESFTVTFDLSNVDKNNLYLKMHSWENDPPPLQPLPFNARANESLKIDIVDNTHPEKVLLSLKDVHPRDIALSDDMVDLKEAVKAVTGNTLTIRITWTAHHVVDYIGLIEARPTAMTVEELPLIKAVKTGGVDVLKELVAKDKVYVHLVRGEEIALTFARPQKTLTADDQDSYFFVSSGFYSGLRTYLYPKVDPSMDTFKKKLKEYLHDLDGILKNQ